MDHEKYQISIDAGFSKAGEMKDRILKSGGYAKIG